MRLGPKKRELIYGAAAEAVMRARLRIQHEYVGHGRAVDEILRSIVDDVLFEAQKNAGSWAVRAAETDVRGKGKIRVEDIVPREDR